MTTDPPPSRANDFIEHLDTSQIARLVDTFREWHQAAESAYTRRVRGRYWLAFLFLRFTGARIGEILRIDDSRDIDFEHKEVHIVTPDLPNSRQIARRIPLPSEIIERVLAYRDMFPPMIGRVFALDQGNFRREFYRRAEEAQLPKELSHPHILRHTRAVEMLRAGVPLTTVQDLLGHALSSTTAIYIQRTEITARRILKEKGLLWFTF